MIADVERTAEVLAPCRLGRNRVGRVDDEVRTHAPEDMFEHSVIEEVEDLWSIRSEGDDATRGDSRPTIVSAQKRARTKQPPIAVGIDPVAVGIDKRAVESRGRGSCIGFRACVRPRRRLAPRSGLASA